MPSLRSLFVSGLVASAAVASKINDFSCNSTSNPVVLLHGLGATFYEDLNFLQYWLQKDGYCTYSFTYGDYDGFPLVGGLKPISESAPQIASYIKNVTARTGKSKVDLVGHSEGAFHSLYVPKFEGVAHLVDKIAAIAPPTHGTSFAGLWKLAGIFGNSSRTAVKDVLDTFGCGACADLVTDGAAVQKLTDGPIVQKGNKVTIIASKHDELVTPPTTSFIHEDGVTNRWIQDTCSWDPVGHIGEAYDLNTWHLVKNVLDDTPDRHFVCLAGSPGRRV